MFPLEGSGTPRLSTPEVEFLESAGRCALYPYRWKCLALFESRMAFQVGQMRFLSLDVSKPETDICTL